MNMTDIKFNEKGLVPAIAQDVNTGAVLMMAWMNEESFKKTQETGYAHYFSRSRQSLWKKGETSGHFQLVKAIDLDCDGDTLLLKVEQTGNACHTGEYSCFHRVMMAQDTDAAPVTAKILNEVYAVIADRLKNPKEGSYTNYLFDKGIDKMCKKVGEEASEVIIAAKNQSFDELRYEVADLLYHVMVLMVQQGMTLEDVYAELSHRR